MSTASGAPPSAGLKPFDKEEMLELLRHVPLPVVVVTAAAKREDGGLRIRGITCSSFSSMSLDPPLVSINVYKASRFMPVLWQSEGFTIHLLSEANKEVANNFARPQPDHDASTFGSAAGEWELDEIRAPGSRESFPAPVLKGTMAAMVCKKGSIIEEGDHYLLVGQVLQVAYGDSGHPLLYMNRQYYRVGDGV